MNVDCFLYILEGSRYFHNYLSTKRFEVCSGIWECQIVNQRDIIIYEDVLFLFLTLLMCLKFTKQTFHRQTKSAFNLTQWNHAKHAKEKCLSSCLINSCPPPRPNNPNNEKVGSSILKAVCCIVELTSSWVSHSAVLSTIQCHSSGLQPSTFSLVNIFKVLAVYFAG